MKKEFTPYEQSLDLKELGFDEPCFGLYENGKLGYSFSTSQGIITPISYRTNSKFVEHILTKEDCTAPTFSQAFRWFREKYNLNVELYTTDMGSIEYSFQIRDLYSEKYVYDNFAGAGSTYTGTFTSFEKAQLACLNKLIEIVNTKQYGKDI
jgi:hypothetical protein